MVNMARLGNNEVQHIGFFGILKESIKGIISQSKLFALLSSLLLLPLSIFFLVFVAASEILFRTLILKEGTFDFTFTGNRTPGFSLGQFFSAWAIFLSFSIICASFLVMFGLLWLAVVIYAVACAYSMKIVSFNQVLSCIPRVWRRLARTFVWARLFALTYYIVGIVLFPLCTNYLMVNAVGVTAFGIFGVVYGVGLLYLCMLWGMASVASVLEDLSGIQSLAKAKALIAEMKVVSWSFSFVVGMLVVIIEAMYVSFVMLDLFGTLESVMVGLSSLLVFMVVILVAPVFQTILYFVCKFHHHEVIDIAVLSHRLESYMGQYVRLQASAVQMESRV